MGATGAIGTVQLGVEAARVAGAVHIALIGRRTIEASASAHTRPHAIDLTMPAMGARNVKTSAVILAIALDKASPRRKITTIALPGAAAAHGVENLSAQASGPVVGTRQLRARSRRRGRRAFRLGRAGRSLGLRRTARPLTAARVAATTGLRARAGTVRIAFALDLRDTRVRHLGRHTLARARSCDGAP